MGLKIMSGVHVQPGYAAPKMGFEVCMQVVNI